MKYKELLSVRGTSLVGLVLVNRSVLSDHLLWSIRRRGPLLSLCLGGGSECENVLSEMALLDKISRYLQRDHH